MSQTYDWPGYNFNYNNQNDSPNTYEYKQALLGQKIQKYADNGMVNSALYNPKTGLIHVTSENAEKFDSSAWNNWARVMDYNRYKEIKALSASGKVNTDQ